MRTVALSRIGATRGPLVFEARTLPLELREVQKNVATRTAVPVYFVQDLFPPRPGQKRQAVPSQEEVAPCSLSTRQRQTDYWSWRKLCDPARAREGYFVIQSAHWCKAVTRK